MMFPSRPATVTCFTFRLISTLCLTLAAALPVRAAEFSTAHIHGFSTDGAYFAFEEFGFSDGTGAPYASFTAIEVATDKWVSGTPITVRASEEEALALEEEAGKAAPGSGITFSSLADDALAAKRAELMQQAAPVLEITGKLTPGQASYGKSVHDYTHDGKSVRFSHLGYERQLASSPEAQVWRLDLAEKDFPAGENCFGMHETTRGYTLTFTDEKTGTTRVLNDDQRVPSSRGCAQGYAIEAVQTLKTSEGAVSLAILLRYTRPGFEGPDGRLLAVTARIAP